MHKTYVVCRHQRLLEALICLSDTHTVVLVERSQGFDLIVEMSRQRRCETFDEGFYLLPVVLRGWASSAVLLELLEARCESPVLLDVLCHQTFDAGDGFDAWKELFLFCIMVVVH